MSIFYLRYVYFSRDVEEVFWGKRISKEEKTKYAMKFGKDVKITEELIIRLNKETRAYGVSNLYMLMKNESYLQLEIIKYTKTLFRTNKGERNEKRRHTRMDK